MSNFDYEKVLKSVNYDLEDCFNDMQQDIFDYEGEIRELKNEITDKDDLIEILEKEKQQLIERLESELRKGN